MIAAFTTDICLALSALATSLAILAFLTQPHP